MHEPTYEDPADTLIAWEAVEELLVAVPEGPAKHVLRMMAAGATTQEIAEHLDMAGEEVKALAARGRMRVLTAALEDQVGD